MINYALYIFSLISCVVAIDTITTKGNAFFTESGDRFYIRGVDYQPGGSSNLFDPLSDPTTCERDIKYFSDLNINTIRIYSIDNTADHDECMQKLADAGIYVILDVNIPDASISRADPLCSYNTMYLEEVFATVENMAQYDNTLGFFAANEVINDEDTTFAAPYVKAVVRDIKTFLKNNGLRTIPVGYSAADIEENRVDTAHYFNCGDDESARVDMFGFNDYSWCGKSSYTTSGYNQKVKAFSNYSVPLFFSEYGCNKITPRPFTEVESIYSTDMTSVFSGGLVYEYSKEESNYGLVEISSDNTTVKTTDDFDNLKSEFEKTKNPSGNGGYQSDLDHSNCPAMSSSWNATSTIPDTPKGALKFLRGDTKPEGNGFDASTQWACVAAGNDEDDSDSPSSGRSSNTRSSSSSSSRASSSDSSSSTRSSEANGSFHTSSILNYLTSFAVICGLSLF